MILYEKTVGFKQLLFIHGDVGWKIEVYWYLIFRIMSPALQTFSAESKRHSSCSSVTAGNVIYLHFILKPTRTTKRPLVALLQAKCHNYDVFIHVNVYFYFVLNLNRRKKYLCVKFRSRFNLVKNICSFFF